MYLPFQGSYGAEYANVIKCNVKANKKIPFFRFGLLKKINMAGNIKKIKMEPYMGLPLKNSNLRLKLKGIIVKSVVLSKPRLKYLSNLINLDFNDRCFSSTNDQFLKPSKLITSKEYLTTFLVP